MFNANGIEGNDRNGKKAGLLEVTDETI